MEGRGGASRLEATPPPPFWVLGQLVTQPSASHQFGGDNDRAAAGVSAQPPRGPLPWPSLGKTTPSEAMGPVHRSQEVKKGKQTPTAGQAPVRNHDGRPRGGRHGPGMPNPGPGLHPGSRAPKRGQEPQDNPAAGGGCWKDAAREPPSPDPQPSGLPPASNRLTPSSCAEPPGFWLRSPQGGSADPRLRTTPKRHGSAS